MNSRRLQPGLHRYGKDEVPAGWQVVRLDAVGRLVRGGRLGLTKERHYGTGDIPAYSAGGPDGRVAVAEFDEDGVVIPCVGSVGRAYRARGTWTTLANTLVILPFPATMDARFLSYRLDGTNFLPLSGTAQPFVKPRELMSCHILAPPVGEQERIARCLELAADELLWSERTIMKLERLKEALLDDLLARHVAIDQTDDGGSGESWELRPLADLTIAPIRYGIVQVGPNVANGVRVLAIRDLHSDFRTGVHRTSPGIDAQYAASRVEPGDVLLSIKGTIGRVGVVPESYVGNISRDIGRLRFGADVIPEFAAQYLRTRSAQRRLERAVVGTTRSEISIHRLRDFLFPVPTVDRQREVVDNLARIDRRIASETQLLKKLARRREGLVADLLSGRERIDEVER